MGPASVTGCVFIPEAKGHLPGTGIRPQGQATVVVANDALSED